MLESPPKLAQIQGKWIDLDRYKEYREVFALSHEDAIIMAEITDVEIKQLETYI